jgi:hypothetical protein
MVIIIDPLEYHVTSHFTGHTVRPLLHPIDSVPVVVCSDSNSVSTLHNPIMPARLFNIGTLTLMSNRPIPTDKRRLSNLIPQCYQHLFRFGNAYILIQQMCDNFLSSKLTSLIPLHIHYYLFLWLYSPN